MPLKSMTGFARGSGEYEGVTWFWELRSVNGRGLDLRFRLPQGTEALEAEVRKLAQANLKRGNIQLSLQIKRSESASTDVFVNEEVLQKMLDAANNLVEKGASLPTADGLLALRGVIEQRDVEEDEEIQKARQKEILDSFSSALQQLVHMRQEEGNRLHSVLGKQIDELENLSNKIDDLPSRTLEAMKERLREQVNRVMETTDKLDEDRLHQEAILLASKADIKEETDRLAGHLEAFRALLNSDDAVGRKLDFLTQELNREANTLCSKSHAADLTKIGLDMKTVIDQIKEQVQNIE